MLRPHAVRPCMLPPMQVNLPAGRCEHEGCIIFALPGYQWQNRRFSNRHLLLGMVRLPPPSCSDSSMHKQRRLLRHKCPGQVPRPVLSTRTVVRLTQALARSRARRFVYRVSKTRSARRAPGLEPQACSATLSSPGS